MKRSEGANPWAGYDPGRIPTKSDRPELDAFLDEVDIGGRALDLGCGTGEVSRALVERGFDVVGLDINPGAIAAATAACPEASFLVRDLASPAGLDLGDDSFRIVVCQLVLSIVGDVEAREALLRNAAHALEPGGALYLSASEVSDEVNPGYRELYLRDFPSTRERYTYYSRDSDGRILYTTHHFTAPELQALIQGAGLELERLASRTESSSRRAGESANFLYLTARRPA